jgi:vitamin B12 transporter
MKSVYPAAGQAVLRQSYWLTSSALVCLSLATGSMPAAAQQTAAPEIQPLPRVVVAAPTPRRAASRSRRQQAGRAPAPASTLPPVPAEPSAANAPVVISPTAIPTDAATVASSVSVITAQDIEREQRRTVPDALSTVPGLNVVQRGGPGAQTSIFMRGTNSNHVKVLIDGIDVSDPSNPNRTFDFGQLLTQDIERIEVLRGPQSGLYGADAVGGVISIITKKGEGPPKATGMIEGGSFGTFNQAAGLSGSESNLNYALNVAHFRAADTPVTPLYLLPPGRQRIGDYYDNMTYSTKLGANLSEDFTVNWVARYTDAMLRFTGDAGFPGVPQAEQSTQIVHQFFTRGEGVWSLLDGRFKNYFGVNYTDHWNWNKSPDFAPSVNKGERTKYDWRGDLILAPGQTLLMGLQQETERLRTDTLRAENGNKAGYIELQSEFLKHFFLVANARHDVNESFGPATTYRIAPALLLPVTETKLKASYGTGFKAPTLNQLFVSFPEFGFFANPNLKPEQAVGYDYGFEQPLFANRVRFGATYFHNDVKNLINAFFDPVNFNSTLINVGEARMTGYEAFASAAVTPSLKLRADYTYTKAIDQITGLELIRRPGHKYTFNTIWNPLDPLTLSATLLHVSSWSDVDRPTFVTIRQKGYTVVNVVANYMLNERVNIFGRVDNLFNEHYQNPNGFERPGLGVFGGIRLANR